jgi:hypothetical protein
MTKPQLSVIGDRRDAPPKPLGPSGMSLWGRVTGAYAITDEGGRELLWQACACEDRRAELSDVLAADGVVIRSRAGPREHPAVKLELASRAFIAKSLERLGLNLETVRGPGNPGTGGLGITANWGK